MFNINNVPPMGQAMLAAVAKAADFERAGNGARLTPLGGFVVDTARRIDERARKRKAAIAAAKASRQGNR
jgi:hypothetical protein